MRDIALEGSPAIEWMADRGWSVLSTVGVFRVFADVIRSESFEMTRIWHTAADVRHDPDMPPRARRCLAIIGITEEQTLRTSAGACLLAAGGVHLQNATEPLTISASTPVARLLVVTPWDRLRASGLSEAQPQIDWTADPDYLRVLVNLTNSVLASGIDPHASGFGGVERGIEALLSAVVAIREPAQLTRASDAELHLLRRAIAVIDRRSSDPVFTVALLADELGVSKTYLHQAFGSTGMTAARRIRFARATEARTRLDDAATTAGVDLNEIARAAGFGSVRTMRRAFDDLERGVIVRGSSPR